MRSHGRLGRRYIARPSRGLGRDIDVNVVGGKTRHDGSLLGGGFVPSGTHFDLIFTCPNTGEGSRSAVLGWSGQMDAAEVGRELDEGASLQRHAAQLTHANDDSDKHLGW